MRDGVSPDIPAGVANAILRSYRSDPPTRYRVEFWLSLIAKMMYVALGGKGEMPAPPWVKHDTDYAVSGDGLIEGLKAAGLGVMVKGFTDAE